MTLFKIIFKMKLFQWRYGLFLLSVALWLPMSNAQALTCKVDSFVSPNLGIITLANVNNASIEQTLIYSCTNTSDVTEWASVCIGVNGGNNNPSQINPRYLSGPDSSKLKFNMTLNGRSGAIWGPRNGEGTEFIDFISVDPGLTTPKTKQITIKTSLLQDNDSATAGNYTSSFTAGNTAFRFVTVNSNNDNQQCLSETQETSQFSFTVQATVDSQCTINTTSDVNLGSHSASQTDITGSNNNAISVTCTNKAPYTIGLAPSPFNGVVNNDGAGVMSGTGSNTDKVPYQLRSTSGTGGTPWGNTATSTTVGNGVAGIGSGAAQTQTVYVTVPSADFKPDNYSDTVTISVNY